MTDDEAADGPLGADALQHCKADTWIGSQPEPATPFKAVILDRATIIERVDEVPAGTPKDVARTWYPELAPLERMPRLRHGDREFEPLTIINRDDRLLYNDWRYPYGLVCRIESRPGRFGSGVLIGPRHVLTASHVLDWERKVASVEVHAFDRGARARAGVIAAHYFTQIDDVEGDTLDEDYAVCVLDQRLGDRYGYMGAKTYNSRWDEDELWQSIGYAEDLAGTRRPQWKPNFYLDEDALDLGGGRAMESNGDFAHGQSGSPIFAWWDQGPYAVAVVSAEIDGDNWCAGGSDLPDLVNTARSEDP